MEETGSPVAQFIENACVLREGLMVPRRVLYAVWRDWAEQSGYTAGSIGTFGRMLESAQRGLRRSQPTIDGERVSCYAGIGLRERHQIGCCTELRRWAPRTQHDNGSTVGPRFFCVICISVRRMAHGRSTTAADGAVIRRLRERRGMNLRQLAEACRQVGRPITGSQLSKIEREICRPRPGLLVALATVYSVEVDTLIKHEEGAA